jgi:hypothetical protein
VLADVAEGEDRLGISAEVNTLCDVIMARDVMPPLSIGLFGDWGTGKSFFMTRMRKRIAWLSEASGRAELEGLETDLCTGVCQIEFNAWHYIDTSLWASLASRIFDQLAKIDAHPEVQQVMQDLPSVRALRLSAEERREQATARLADIDDELLREEPIGLRDLTLAGLSEARDNLAEQAGERADDLLKKAGVPKENVEELNLREMVPQMHRAGGLLFFLMRRGRWTVRLTLALALVLAVAGPPVFTLLLRPYFNGIIAGVYSLIGCVVAALLLAKPYLNRASQFLKVAGDVVTSLDERRQSAAHARREALQQRIAVIQEEIEVLDGHIDSLKDASSIQVFALKRLVEDDYRRQEGLLALLRRDLEELSRRLAPPHASDLERIVLYIDDLVVLC